MGYTTKIDSNGSMWIGETPDSIDKLYQVLQDYCLDPTFEEYGNFILVDDELGTIHFWGNFLKLSHVFSIDTNDPEVIDRLTKLIRNNQKREDYQAEIKAREQEAQELEEMEKNHKTEQLEALKIRKVEIEKEIIQAEGKED